MLYRIRTRAQGNCDKPVMRKPAIHGCSVHEKQSPTRRFDAQATAQQLPIQLLPKMLFDLR